MRWHFFAIACAGILGGFGLTWLSYAAADVRRRHLAEERGPAEPWAGDPTPLFDAIVRQRETDELEVMWSLPVAQR